MDAPPGAREEGKGKGRIGGLSPGIADGKKGDWRVNEKEKRIANRARMTAGRMRALYRATGNRNYKEAGKAIESLLGLVGRLEEEDRT